MNAVGRVIAAIMMFAISVGLAAWVGQDSVEFAGLPGLVVCALVAIGINWLGFIPASMKQTESFYDLVGSMTYLTVVALALVIATQSAELTLQGIITATMVAVWALRLGSFLYKRIHKAGRDPRFDDIKRSRSKFFFAWTAQGMWVFMTLFAVLISLTGSQPIDSSSDPVTLLGWVIWAAGFAIEVIADRQKSAFNAEPNNKGRWIDTGLWKTSQHPNYFGETLLWTGLFIAGIPSYTGLEWLACISPIFVCLLLTRGSGIPLLDERAMAKWGDDPEYLAYRERTSKFICLPSKG